MLRAVLVDDEHPSREVLAGLLKRFCPQVEVAGEAADTEAAFRMISSLKPDLVFLDIQMPGGNGFRLLEKFQDIFFHTIFVTSYDQYAISAIKFSALDYLLKPVDVEELKKAVDKAVKESEKANRYESLYKNLLNNLKPENKDKKMVIHENANALLIPMSEVGWIEADSNYSCICMIGGQKHYTAKTLKEIEEFTQDLPGFVRINRSVLINVSFCSHYQKGEPYNVVLKNGVSFEISRRKRPEVLEKLKALMAG